MVLFLLEKKLFKVITQLLERYLVKVRASVQLRVHLLYHQHLLSVT